MDFDALNAQEITLSENFDKKFDEVFLKGKKCDVPANSRRRHPVRPFVSDFEESKIDTR